MDSWKNDFINEAKAIAERYIKKVDVLIKRIGLDNEAKCDLLDHLQGEVIGTYIRELGEIKGEEYHYIAIIKKLRQQSEILCKRLQVQMPSHGSENLSLKEEEKMLENQIVEYESKINDLSKFRENPDQPDDEEEDDKKKVDIEPDDESIKMPSKLPEKKGVILPDDAGDSSDSDDSSWNSNKWNKKQQLSAKKLQHAKSPTPSKSGTFRSVLSGSKKNLLSSTPGPSGVAASTLSGSRRNLRTPTGGTPGIFSAAKRKLPPTNLFSNSKRKTPKKGVEDIPKIKISDRTINHQKNIRYSFEKKKRLEKIRRLSKVLEEKSS